MKPIRIYVSAKDIAGGEHSAPNVCPIAKAIKRLTKTRVPYVDGCTCRIGTGKKRHKFVLPDSAQAFIERFDNWCSVTPFSFRLTKRVA